MKKLFLSLLCAMSVLAVNAQTTTIQGVLVTEPEPCIGEECVTTCLSLAIATADKTYFINGKCGDAYIATTIDGVEVLLGEGDEVIATGTVTTHVNNNGDEFYKIDITSINKREKVDWCTQWNIMEFRFASSVGGDDFAQTYIYVADGDTTIADKTYTKISYYHSLTPDKKQYAAAIRQQGDSVMIHYEQADYLLYDFGVKVGDERDVFVGINNWEVGVRGTYKNKVTDVSILSDGRKRISVDIYWSDTNGEYYDEFIESGEWWIEGVGSADGILHTGADGGRVGGYSNALLCASNEEGGMYNSGWSKSYTCVYNYDSRDAETPPTIHEGHEYVNLGLPSGTLWATCNVDAYLPEATGLYYAWGETRDKSYYDWGKEGDYKWGIYNQSALPDYGMTKYNTTDGKTVLDAADDAATANWAGWGGKWRMPTAAEQQELINECTWAWTTLNGMNGYRVTSKKDTSKSIFLPAAGFRVSSHLYGIGSQGYYKSSSLVEDEVNSAHGLYFKADDYYTGINFRYGGETVRPVFSNNNTTVENVEQISSSYVRKVFENGTLYILRNNEKYTIDGRKVE